MMNKTHYKIINNGFWFLLATFGGMLIITGSVYLYLNPKLPSVEKLRQINLQTPLRIYSEDLELIGEFGEKHRNPIGFQDIPLFYIQALISAEDGQFYSHSGVDIGALLRATVELISSGDIKTGGSTITMQVARNFFLAREQTFTRKFNEILLAFRIEATLSKNEILTLYANKIYQGNRAYGVSAAAHVYYGRPIQTLTLSQLAMLAGLPKAPSAYNPIANPKRALIRRNWILDRMHDLDYINLETLILAKNEPITASYHGYKVSVDSPYVSEMVRKKVSAMIGESAYTDGFRVYTTIDSRLQKSAQKAIRKGVIAYDKRHGYRGPESNIHDPELWNNILQSTLTYGDLIPGVVKEVHEQQLNVLLANKHEILISWERGLKNLRKYNNPDSQSRSIKTANELFATGDLIRVRQNNDHWELAQLPKVQAAIVALNPRNGAIKALVGGFDFRQNNFNRITQATRQPGSNFKPFIYAIALENGFTAASIINDAPLVFEDKRLKNSWRPENDGGTFYGPTRLRKALYLSRNLVSIRILQSIGIETAISGLGRFGFDGSKLPRNLSLALGSHATTPLKIAAGYAILANEGYQIEPYLIDRIEDAGGNLIYQANPLTACNNCNEIFQESSKNQVYTHEKISPHVLVDMALELKLTSAPRVIDPQTVYIVDSMLRDVIKKGTGRRAKVLNRSDIAGKTGTTNGPKDAWFSGYNPDIVATAWLGFDDNLLLGRNEYGGSAALPIWIDFMRDALAEKIDSSRRQPTGLITIRIDPDTGLRVGTEQKNALFEVFKKKNIPPLAEKNTKANTSIKHKSSPSPEDLF
jgi:penicillin-binding protein 1A